MRPDKTWAESGSEKLAGAKIREHDKEKLMISEEKEADHEEPLMLRN